MAVLLRGADVAAAMKDSLMKEARDLRDSGITPALVIMRVGAREDDMSYERGALKRCATVGIDAKSIALPEDINQAEFDAEFERVNGDPSVHGILLLRPLPCSLSDRFARSTIDPCKDVDGMSFVNEAKVFAGDTKGQLNAFAPCTPCAVMEMLSRYGISPEGKNVVIVGRSMVIGRPVAMLMLAANATVTVCHTRTENLAKICRSADIIVAAAGRAGLIGAEFVTDRSVVVDVGINIGPDGKMCGDVDFEAVSRAAAAVSPVPGGVGAVTASVLAKHVLTAAEVLSSRK